jgi:hypothetical protein
MGAAQKISTNLLTTSEFPKEETIQRYHRHSNFAMQRNFVLVLGTNIRNSDPSKKLTHCGLHDPYVRDLFSQIFERRKQASVATPVKTP